MGLGSLLAVVPVPVHAQRPLPPPFSLACLPRRKRSEASVTKRDRGKRGGAGEGFYRLP